MLLLGVNRVLPAFACLHFLVTACSGSVEVIDKHDGTSTSAGSGGSGGMSGAGGDKPRGSTGGDAGASTTGSTTGSTSSTTGAGGAGGAGPAEAGMDAAEEGDSSGGGRDAAGVDTGAPPPIDYSIWELQLPTGSGTSPTTVPPSQLATFSNIYFYKAADGGQIFMDPATGVTTPNSTRCRTELRETNPAGGEAAWSASGTNTMAVTGKVTKGSGITIGQVFNGTDGITLAELQYSPGGFTLFYEESRSGGNSTNLGNATPLDTRYSFTMALSNNVLTITLNGKQVFQRTPGSGISANKFYFKVGNYDQGTTSGTPGTTAHSIVEDYSVVVLHQ